MEVRVRPRSPATAPAHLQSFTLLSRELQKIPEVIQCLIVSSRRFLTSAHTLFEKFHAYCSFNVLQENVTDNLTAGSASSQGAQIIPSSIVLPAGNCSAESNLVTVPLNSAFVGINPYKKDSALGLSRLDPRIPN
jgi:hypothetical protein